MEWIASILITWTTILAPPVVIRAIRKRPLSKAPAIGIAFILFFANHIIFAVMTGVQSSRGFLSVGAVVSYFVLRWQTKASAAETIAAQRKSLGYED